MERLTLYELMREADEGSLNDEPDDLPIRIYSDTGKEWDVLSVYKHDGELNIDIQEQD